MTPKKDETKIKFAAGTERRERMVAAVVETFKATGKCAPKDLLLKGFTPVDVERHWPMAYALAKVQLDIKDAE